MTNKSFFWLGAALAGAMWMASAFFMNPKSATDLAQKRQHRIVFQITTADTAAFRALTRQLNNVLDGWPQAKIEVVAHNKGIGMLQKNKSNVPDELEALRLRGVQFVACEQTLKQQKLEKTDILPLAGFVPRGLLEIVEKQEQGWSYIKAGF